MHLDETEFLDDVLLFEFETFLFQVQSTLDIFFHFLELFYPSIDSIGFKGERGCAGKKTIKTIKKDDEHIAVYIKGEVSLWIQRLYDLRNRVAHRERVKEMEMFLIDNEGIHLPKIKDHDMDILSYCEETYENLKKFIFHIEEAFLLKKAKHFFQKSISGEQTKITR
ncbi:MAG: hypothetical protein EOM19_07250 [Candidatus Moranbacteria bacterium]|nr:hypothetical protein [Candidatus Moranbacteria bacterium]